MATKISGIKGINISKASVLKDGSKKTNTNDSFRDTSNGTTRDNSNNPSVLDAAMIKMLLGNTELMAKKAEEIEANMKRREREEERREQENTRREIERVKREEERERNKNEYKEKKAYGNFEGYYKNIDNGIVNSLLSSFIGPAGVLLGKGLNAAGLPLEEFAKKGIFKAGRGIRNLFTGRSNINEDSENNNALDVNKREMAAKPINDFKIIVSKKLDQIINLIGGKSTNKQSSKESSFLDSMIPLLVGTAINYGPAKEFGIKYLLKKFHKPFDFIIKQFGKLGSWIYNKIAKKLLIKKATEKGLEKGAVKAAEKAAAKAAEKAIKKASIKTIEESTKKAAIKQLQKTAGKTTLNSAEKKLASTIAKETVKKSLEKSATTKIAAKAASKATTGVILKKLPVISALTGLVFGVGRAIKGDWGGAGLELLSGLASTVPYIGTAGSIGIDAAILARDIARDIEKAKEESIKRSFVDITNDDVKSQEMFSLSRSPKSEGDYTTENTNKYESFQIQNQTLNIQNQILESLEQIELNLNPTTQKELDKSYLDNAQKMFQVAPEYYNSQDGYFDLNFNDKSVLGV